MRLRTPATTLSVKRNSPRAGRRRRQHLRNWIDAYLFNRFEHCSPKERSPHHSTELFASEAPSELGCVTAQGGSTSSCARSVAATLLRRCLEAGPQTLRRDTREDTSSYDEICLAVRTFNFSMCLNFFVVPICRDPFFCVLIRRSFDLSFAKSRARAPSLCFSSLNDKTLFH